MSAQDNWIEEIREDIKNLARDMQTVRTVLVGVENTDHRGVVGDIKLLKDCARDNRRDIDDHSSRIGTLETTCKANHSNTSGYQLDKRILMRWLVGVATVGAFLGGVLVALGDRFNIW